MRTMHATVSAAMMSISQAFVVHTGMPPAAGSCYDVIVACFGVDKKRDLVPKSRKQTVVSTAGNNQLSVLGGRPPGCPTAAVVGLEVWLLSVF